jgi:uncharacterized lipoprotein YajG
MNVRLLFSAAAMALLFLAACSRAPSTMDSSRWMMESLQRMPQETSTWSLTGMGGGSSAEGGAYQFELDVKGIPAVQAQRELRAVITRQLEKDGYTVTGGGSGGDVHFDIRAKSRAIQGTLSVSFFDVSPTKVAVNIAIAQVARTAN